MNNKIKKTILILGLASLISLNKPQLAKANFDFPDIKPEDWYYNVVTDLAGQGIVKGYEDGTYKPQNNVTYAEFLTLLNNTLGEKQENYQENGNYGKWYQNTFDYLTTRGVLEEKVNPNAKINRYEMAKYLSLALENLAGRERNTKNPGTLADYHNIPKDYVEYVANTVNNGVIKGDENKNFRGDSNLTRAEVAQVIKNLQGLDKNEQVVVTGKTFEGSPIEGVDTFHGKPYKVPQNILDHFEGYEAKYKQKALDQELLQKFGMEYIKEVQIAIDDGSTKEFTMSVINRDIRVRLSSYEADIKSREEGRTPIGDVDWSSMSPEELAKHE